jgi:hypothetical protein
MDKIINEIKKRRKEQNEKFGVSSHPCLDQTLLNREGSCTPQRMCEEYHIPSENVAKYNCDNAFYKNQGTWAHIAVEELSEIVSEFDLHKRRNEIIDLAAVCIAWLEDIDNKIIKEEWEKTSKTATEQGYKVHHILAGEFKKFPTKNYPGRIYGEGGEYKWVWNHDETDGNWVKNG